jgi:hypothetical protein
MLDGDDRLSNNNVLTILNKIYLDGALVSYGSYQFLENNKISNYIYGNEEFPLDILNKRNFREYRWISCHLRSGYAGLFKRIRLLDMLDDNNNFLKCCTDLCEMYSVLEMSSPNIVKCPYSLYIYNKDASIKNKNSYYNINKNNIEKLYREYVNYKIKNTQKYGMVCLDSLLSSRYILLNRDDYEISPKIDRFYVNKLLKLLDITKLKFIGYSLKVYNPLFLYDKKIKVGRIEQLNNIFGIKKRGYKLNSTDLVVSIDDYSILDIYFK